MRREPAPTPSRSASHPAPRTEGTPVIPLYDTDHPELFAIEPAAMDHPGLVIDRLDDLVPPGTVSPPSA